MNEGGYAMRHMEIIPDDLQCAFALLLILLLLILAFWRERIWRIAQAGMADSCMIR